MIITNLRIYNFGPFYESHEINFENNGCGVHLIRGNNGQGKTSLQQAILWALYGKINNRKGKEIPITSLINRTAVKEFNLSLEVKIFFNHENENWTLTRETHGKYHRVRDYNKNMSLYLVKDGTPQVNPQLLTNRIIPYNVNKFFFFDGEMLRDYEELLDQNSSSMKKLKNDVEHVLGIPYLSLARDDVKAVKEKFEKDKTRLLRNISESGYDELAEKLEESASEIKRIEDLIKKMENQYDQLELDMSDKNRELTDYEATRKIALEKIKLLNEMSVFENKEDEINKNNRALVSNLYKTIIIDISKNIIKQLELKHEEVMGKYNKKQRLLKHISDIQNGIDNQKCRLCGNILNKEKLEELEKEKKEVMEQIKSLTEIPEPNLEYDGSVKILERMIQRPIDRSKFVKNESELNKIYHEMATKNSRLIQIEELLENVDEEEPFRIQNEIRQMQAELTRLELEIEDSKELLRAELANKSEIDQKLKSINERDFKILETRIDNSTRIMNLFETSISQFRESRRKDVEKIATEVFLKIRSKEDFISLEINDNFGLSIITSNGDKLDKSEWRSAGEEQIVALSLIGALNKCAQISAPIFMDTPFSRLDIAHGERVLKYIPTISQQIVLLVTDREFRIDDEKHLQGKIGTDYTLVHRGEERGTQIIPTSNLGGV